MIRDHGQFIPRRPHKLDAPILSMLFSALHDHHEGRIFALQVGAGNGETGLPLLPRYRTDAWSGLLIEPLPRHFAALETLHAESDRVAVLNLGISDTAANLPLHALTPDAEARSRRARPGRASLQRDRIAIPGAQDNDVESVEVPFLRMDTVLSELGIDSAQLVTVNAGGHEAQVLSSFDLADLDPSLVCIHTTPGTLADDVCTARLEETGMLAFRLSGWLVGLAPDRLTLPMEDLLTFFRKAADATPDAPSDAEE